MGALGFVLTAYYPKSLDIQLVPPYTSENGNYDDDRDADQSLDLP